jgi:predicted dehydrogenase
MHKRPTVRIPGHMGTGIDFHGRPREERRLRAGFIGCGSHSFRNVYPALQYMPLDLAAICDLDESKARAFAARFGGCRPYTDHRRMLAEAGLDAVFIVTGYDAKGRPLYPDLAIDSLRAGAHVWMEKPPAATVRDVDRMAVAARAAGRSVVVGLKKMFAPANAKARDLARSPDFGAISQASLQYPQYVPTKAEFDRYFRGNAPVGGVVGFLDHLCHPLSVLVALLGRPRTLYYERSHSGAGVALFTCASGAVASLSMTHGASCQAPMERTMITSDRGRHIVVENNFKVSYYKGWALPYGASPDFYRATPGQAASVWEPEMSLGQLYNKGLFLLGYYAEVREFCDSIIEGRAPAGGTLEQARIITEIFEAFAKGPGKRISLGSRGRRG